MPLPLLLVPLAAAGGSALAQAIAKLRSHRRLNELRDELERLESQHRGEMRRHFDLQVDLCRQLGRQEPELPAVLHTMQQPDVTEPPVPRWRRLLKRRARTVADGSPHTRFGIIGRHGASFAASAVWRTSSTAIINVVRPVGMRLLTFAPRFASIGGTGGSIAASTGLRFALGAFTVVGIVVGPILAVWSIISEVKKVRKARRELEAKRMQRESELTEYAATTGQLQMQLAGAADGGAAPQ